MWASPPRRSRNTYRKPIRSRPIRPKATRSNIRNNIRLRATRSNIRLGYPGQGYGTNNPIQGVIDQLLGNRYNVNDRTAVQYCAAAAVADASARYRPNYNQGYGQQPYGQGYQTPYGGQNAQGYGNAYGYSARVTSITNVERRDNGLRVSGTLDSGRYGGYGNQGYNRQGYNTQGTNTPGYGNPGYGVRGYAGAYGDLTFRCNVDYRGAVTNLRVRPNTAFRRPY